ncbi:MAG: HepT-like ribonuclease domain-containing protein [Bryobacteraceae bacterium]
MSFRNQKPQSLLHDILDAIRMIEEFTTGIDFKAFRSNPMAVAAVERKLLIIAEAGVRLRQDAPALCPDQPWRNIRGMGNWLRHEYDRVDLSLVWQTVTDDLPSLKVAIQKALSTMPSAEPE